jgi:uncharacterized alpha-E superfamily protein
VNAPGDQRGNGHAGATGHAPAHATTRQDDSAQLNQPARPILSRDADSIYWMARYVERAEHVARLLLVNANLLIDVGDLAPSFQHKQWLGLLDILRVGAPPGIADVKPRGQVAQRIARFMSFDANNPSSLITCLSRARDNAKAIREVISAEMWENINQLYWSIRGDDAAARFDDAPDEFYRSIMTGSMLFQGFTDQTLAHDQRWLFSQAAKYLERIDLTARIIQTRYALLTEASPGLEAALRNIHWMGVLRSCCAIEAYRRSFIGELEGARVASFLILQRDFPRAIAFCVEHARDAVAALRPGARSGAVDPSQRILGRLSAQLEYAAPAEIIADGPGLYLQRIQDQTAEAAAALQHTYFLY